MSVLNPTIDRLLDGFEERYNARGNGYSDDGDFHLVVFVGCERFAFALTKRGDVVIGYSEFPIMQTAEARELIRKELEKVL